MSHRNYCKELIPAERIFLITPSDTDNLIMGTRGISIGVTGTLRVLTVKGDDVTIPDGALVIGVIHALAVRMVYATGTTATEIVGYA